MKPVQEEDAKKFEPTDDVLYGERVSKIVPA